MSRIDLHVHTTASDGTESPSAVVALAKQSGLSAIAVTDHDCVSGYREALEAGNALGVEVVPGIEISTKYGGAVHILGYFVDPESEHLQPVLEWIVKDRDLRNRRMAEMMRADGIDVDYDEMKQRFGDVVGRPHFARILVESGKAESIKDAFDKYVEKGKKYWLPRNFIDIESSIQIILDAGGVPVLAHPFQYKRDDAGLRELIQHCMECGLRGMECRYSGYTPEQENYLEALAEEYSLIRTGGSDFHGSNKPHIQLGSGTGGLDVPYEFLSGLKDAAGKGRSTK